jgi:ATP-dependent Clp protease ATP-binding subunit ClpB
LNRIDEIVLFHPLGKEPLAGIAAIQLHRVNGMLLEKGYRHEVSESPRDYLAETGYNPDFGARPLKRTIQRELLDPLALKILAGEYKEGDIVHIDRGDQGLVFSLGH